MFIIICTHCWETQNKLNTVMAKVHIRGQPFDTRGGMVSLSQQSFIHDLNHLPGWCIQLSHHACFDYQMWQQPHSFLPGTLTVQCRGSLGLQMSTHLGPPLDQGACCRLLAWTGWIYSAPQQGTWHQWHMLLISSKVCGNSDSVRAPAAVSLIILLYNAVIHFKPQLPDMSKPLFTKN